MTTVSDALCRFDRILTYLGSDQGGDLPDAEPKLIDETDSDDIPVGPFPNPPFRCYAVSYFDRIRDCSVVFVESVRSNHLMFDYVFDYGDSGGRHLHNVVCDKESLPADMKTILDTAKLTTTESSLIEKDIGSWKVEIQYGSHDIRLGVDAGLGRRKRTFSIPEYFAVEHNVMAVFRRFEYIQKSVNVFRQLQGALVFQLNSSGAVRWYATDTRPAGAVEESSD
jgi:hypothetical protein